MKEEVWKDIQGYEGYYQISNMGRVKSVKRIVWNNSRGCYVTVPERIMKGRKDKDGYLLAHLSKDGKAKNYKIHRLVAVAFIGNPNNLPVINHKNEIKSDNRVSNLEWCSYSYNNSYNDKGKKIGKKAAKKLGKPIFSIDRETGLIMWWESIAEAARQTGISKSSICDCCKGRRKSASNFYWYYADSDVEQ